eukprot:CAMPEP_0197192092 /NCGR_PEP_ID=MMETSP1423-20130617/24524_1 /TAXON_ID=476441 /ORGANISM="Pseudo-nitzschia heimii, Strain UNC1101" /LENGTH=239 /DNA_ID=CAMNT_0042644913 /DNA_START=85 /DNA_END=804 /DNA_ORIENTATION=-
MPSTRRGTETGASLEVPVERRGSVGRLVDRDRETAFGAGPSPPPPRRRRLGDRQGSRDGRVSSARFLADRIREGSPDAAGVGKKGRRAAVAVAVGSDAVVVDGGVMTMTKTKTKTKWQRQDEDNPEPISRTRACTRSDTTWKQHDSNNKHTNNNTAREPPDPILSARSTETAAKTKTAVTAMAMARTMLGGCRNRRPGSPSPRLVRLVAFDFPLRTSGRRAEKSSLFPASSTGSFPSRA